MEGYEYTLDLLDGDGDDAMEMCLFFDDDKKNKIRKPPSNSVCCVVLLAIGSSLAGVVRGISHCIT